MVAPSGGMGSRRGKHQRSGSLGNKAGKGQDERQSPGLVTPRPPPQGERSPPAAGLGAQWGFAFWRVVPWTGREPGPPGRCGRQGSWAPRALWTAGELGPLGAVDGRGARRVVRVLLPVFLHHPGQRFHDVLCVQTALSSVRHSMNCGYCLHKLV